MSENNNGFSTGATRSAGDSILGKLYNRHTNKSYIVNQNSRQMVASLKSMAERKRQGSAQSGLFDSSSVSALGIGDLDNDTLKRMAYNGQIEVTDPDNWSGLTVKWANGWNADRYRAGSNTFDFPLIETKRTKVSPTGRDVRQVNGDGDSYDKNGFLIQNEYDDSYLRKQYYPYYQEYMENKGSYNQGPNDTLYRRAYVDAIIAAKEGDADKFYALKPLAERDAEVRTYGTKYGKYAAAHDFNEHAQLGTKYDDEVDDDTFASMYDYEKKMFRYLRSKYGKDVAEEYVDYIGVKSGLTARVGKARAEEVEASRGGAWGDLDYWLASGGLAFESGWDNSMQGYKQLFSAKAVRPTSTQYANAYFSADLTGVDKVAYGIVQQVGNMAPMILVTTAATAMGVPAPVVSVFGATMVGASAAGNAYTDALNRGYDTDQALQYSFCIGASEALLQYFLGGLAKAGGLKAGATMTKVAALDSALFRFAGSVAVKGGSEAFEETLQLFLEPLFNSMIFGEEYDVPTWEDIIYTSLVSFFSANLLEGGEIASITINGDGTNGISSEQTRDMAIKYIADAIAKVTGKDAGVVASNIRATQAANAVDTANARYDLVDAALKGDKNSGSHKLAESIRAKIDAGEFDKISATEIGQLANMMRYEKTTSLAEARKSERADARKTKLAEIFKPAKSKTEAADTNVAENTELAKLETIQAENPDVAVVPDSVKLFMEAGDDSTTAARKAEILARILSGDTSITNSQLRKIDMQSQATRSVLEQITGATVPHTTDTKTLLNYARSLVEQYAESNAEPDSAQAEIDAFAAKAAEEALSVNQERAKSNTPVHAVTSAQVQGMDTQAIADAQDAAQARASAEIAAQHAKDSAGTTPSGAPTETPTAGSVRLSDGTTVSKDKFIKSYRAANPNKGRAVAERMYADAVRHNAMGEAYPAAVLQKVDSVAQDSAGAKKRNSLDAETSSLQDAAETSQENAEGKPSNVQDWTVKHMNYILSQRKGGPKVALSWGLGTKENGFYDEATNTIYLNGNKLTSQLALTYTLGHELVHSVPESHRGGLVDSIIEFGMKLNSQHKDWYETEYESTRNTYVSHETKLESEKLAKKKGIKVSALSDADRAESRTKAEATVTKKFVREEMAADLMRELLTSTKGIIHLANGSQQTRGWLSKLHTIAEKVMSVTRGKKDMAARALYNEAEALVDRMDAALKTERDSDTLDVENKDQGGQYSVDREAGESEDQAGYVRGGNVRGSGGVPSGNLSVGANRGLPEAGSNGKQRKQIDVNALRTKAITPDPGSDFAGAVDMASEYGVKAHISPEVLMREDGKHRLGLASEGEIFLADDLKGKQIRQATVHEITHTMRQNSFWPYIKFMQRVDGLLLPTRAKEKYLDYMVNYCRDYWPEFKGTDVELHYAQWSEEQTGTVIDENQQADVIDEVCAWMAGNYAVGGDISKLDGDLFSDSRAFAAELTKILEQYKAENRQINNTETRFSAKTEEGVSSIPETGKRYSVDDGVYAPTYYSHMERVIEGIKQEKFGAATVLQTLKNKGVRAEEIKWTGVEEFLEGKKSVTKQELLNFVRENALTLTEEELSGTSDTERDITVRTATTEQMEEAQRKIAEIDDELQKLRSKVEAKWDEFFYEAMPQELFETSSPFDLLMDWFEPGDNDMLAILVPVEDYLRLSTRRNELQMSVAEGTVAPEEVHSDPNGTTWGEYKLDGGENYREYLYRIPEAYYTNEAMQAHWGKRGFGVLAHARVQDFVTDGNKILFIEEIQSDWHNEGHKIGYEESAISFDEDSLTDWADDEYENTEKVPDAPYKKNYHEYVLKSLLRKAAEGDYTHIAWTSSQIQMERWNPDRKTNAEMGVDSKKPDAVAFEEGYKIEYDREIPDFLRSHTKNWGGQLEEIQVKTGGRGKKAKKNVSALKITDAMKNAVLFEGQARYSIDRTMPYESQVESAINDPLEENSHRAVYIRETPNLLAEVGLGDLPMAITARHIQNIIHDIDPKQKEWHGVSVSVVKLLPELLSRPVAILDSQTKDGEVVVVTSAFDQIGRPVIVSIKPNGSAWVDGERGPANFITSLYGRNTFFSWLDWQAKDGRVLYWNEKRSRDMFRKLQDGSSKQETNATSDLMQILRPSRKDVESASPAQSASGKLPPNLETIPSDTIIREHKGYVKENIPKRRFSVDRPTIAPTFYSHMERVVEGVKQDKLGASSVVSMLKGKGVKDEEIKWSGITEFLEGKKSVTKQELLEFIRANELEIETKILEDSTGLNYSAADLRELEECKRDRDEAAAEIDALLSDGPLDVAAEWQASRELAESPMGLGQLDRADFRTLRDTAMDFLTEEVRSRKEKEPIDELRALCDRNDFFGFDSRQQALDYVRRKPLEVVKNYDMDTADQEYLTQYAELKRRNDEAQAIYYKSDEFYKLMEVVSFAEQAIQTFIKEDNIKEDAASAGKQTKWSEYTSSGGQNYRELLFRLPSSDYTNNAMAMHWDGEGVGVVAHARVQDFKVSDGKVLFIEEIQSDWHNEGHKIGYATTNATSDLDAAKNRLNELYGTIDSNSRLATIRDKLIPGIIEENRRLGQEITDETAKEYAVNKIMTSRDSADLARRGGVEFTEIERDDIDNLLSVRDSLQGELAAAQTANWAGKKRPPEAPYSKNYHEFVLKNLLRKAAEGGYSYLAWTTGKMQEERWSSEYAEGYRIEYDQDIPKFLNKYGKKWGAKVGEIELPNGETVWSMPITDTMRDSVLYEGQPRYSVDKEKKTKTGGNTGNVNPDTGYERGSVADSFMRIWNTGDRAAALGVLEKTVQRLSEMEAEQAEKRRTETLTNTFRPAGQLKEDVIARNKRVVEELIAKYGEMEQTSAAQQEVHLPKQRDDKSKVRGFLQTAAAAEVTNEAVLNEFERAIVDGDAGAIYVPIGDKGTMRRVTESIEKKGFEKALSDWEHDFESGKALSKDDIAMAEQLYVEACNNRDTVTAMKLAAQIAVAGTQAGQTVQAMTLLKKMTPSGNLYYIQKAVDRLNKDQKGKHKDIVINEQLAKQLLEAETQEEIQAALDAICQDLADQMPVTLMDKWNTWRYLAMLGNPRTHIRNLLGNAVFTPARLMKDMLAATMELTLPVEQRTKAFAVSAELRDFAKQDAEVMKDTLRGGGKYNPADMIRDKRRIFKSGVLNWAEQFNSSMLEAEDWVFLRSAYSRALGSFLSARGVSLDEVSGANSTREGRALLEEARTYAVKEAQRATYRDISKIANELNHFKRNHRVLGVLLDGVVPFTKTPINIVKRGIEYSPAGLFKGIVDMTTKVRKGDMNAAEAIDEMCEGLTGTGILLLGALLTRMGILVPGHGDDDEDEFDEMQGVQAYSLRIGDFTFTIDWTAPVALPLFVGSEIYTLMSEGVDDSADVFDAIADGLTTMFEPMLSLSMLDGLNKTLSANKYGEEDDALYNILATILTSYVSQGVPTLFGQIARTIDDSRRVTFTPKGMGKIDSWFSRAFQTNVLGKVPFLSDNRMLYVDNWGRTDTESNVLVRILENFISPGYIDGVKTTAVDAEIERLSKALNDTSVMPDRAQKSFSVNGETYAMTQDEYQAHLIERGQHSYQLVNNIINDAMYTGLSDQEKAAAIQLAYKYAAELAKYHTNEAYKMDKWMSDLYELEQRGGDVAEYLMLRAQTDVTNKDRSDKVSLTETAIASDNLTTDEMIDLIISETTMPNKFADPYATGYEYVMTPEQKTQYTKFYRNYLAEAYRELLNDPEYRRASASEKYAMILSAKNEVGKLTREAMSDWFWERNIDSTPKG